MGYMIEDMAICLRCDNCPKVITEQDDELPSWWSLGRYGADWIDPPGHARNMAVVSTPTVMFMSAEDDDDDEGDYIEYGGTDESSVEAYIEENGGMATEVTLHFCSASCLQKWALQAEAFEA